MAETKEEKLGFTGRFSKAWGEATGWLVKGDPSNISNELNKVIKEFEKGVQSVGGVVETGVDGAAYVGKLLSIPPRELSRLVRQGVVREHMTFLRISQLRGGPFNDVSSRYGHFHPKLKFSNFKEVEVAPGMLGNSPMYDVYLGKIKESKDFTVGLRNASEAFLKTAFLDSGVDSRKLVGLLDSNNAQNKAFQSYYLALLRVVIDRFYDIFHNDSPAGAMLLPNDRKLMKTKAYRKQFEHIDKFVTAGGKPKDLGLDVTLEEMAKSGLYPTHIEALLKNRETIRKGLGLNSFGDTYNKDEDNNGQTLTGKFNHWFRDIEDDLTKSDPSIAIEDIEILKSILFDRVFAPAVDPKGKYREAHGAKTPLTKESISPSIKEINNVVITPNFPGATYMTDGGKLAGELVGQLTPIKVDKKDKSQKTLTGYELLKIDVKTLNPTTRLNTVVSAIEKTRGDLIKLHTYIESSLKVLSSADNKGKENYLAAQRKYQEMVNIFVGAVISSLSSEPGFKNSKEFVENNFARWITAQDTFPELRGWVNSSPTEADSIINDLYTTIGSIPKANVVQGGSAMRTVSNSGSTNEIKTLLRVFGIKHDASSISQVIPQIHRIDNAINVVNVERKKYDNFVGGEPTLTNPIKEEIINALNNENLNGDIELVFKGIIGKHMDGVLGACKKLEDAANLLTEPVFDQLRSKVLTDIKKIESDILLDFKNDFETLYKGLADWYNARREYDEFEKAVSEAEKAFNNNNNNQQQLEDLLIRIDTRILINITKKANQAFGDINGKLGISSSDLKDSSIPKEDEVIKLDSRANEIATKLKNLIAYNTSTFTI